MNLVRPVVPPLVLANYFPWYDPGTWDTGCMSGADRPQDGVYNSDDPVSGVSLRRAKEAQAFLADVGVVVDIR